MKYAAIKKRDVANGPGVRVSLFVSGCRRHCPGCFNQEAQDFDYGTDYTVETIREILDLLDPYYVSGISILGGEPLEPENINELTALCKGLKTIFKDKTVWIYTGFSYENVKDLEIMDYVDVLVDGPFFQDLADPSLVFRGSSNQRVIDIKKTRAAGVIKEVNL